MPDDATPRRFDRSGHFIEVLAEAEALEGQRKSAAVTLLEPSGTTFTLRSDEGDYLRGDDSAPPPLSYLASSIAF